MCGLATSFTGPVGVGPTKLRRDPVFCSPAAAGRHAAASATSGCDLQIALIATDWLEVYTANGLTPAQERSLTVTADGETSSARE